MSNLKQAHQIRVGSYVSLTSDYLSEREDWSLHCIYEVYDANTMHGLRIAPVVASASGTVSLDYTRSIWIDRENLNLESN